MIEKSAGVRGLVLSEFLDLNLRSGHWRRSLANFGIGTLSMAGHSQFKNIMHRKGKQDAARSKLFAKLAREITTAAKSGTPDPDMNARLRLAVQAARAENMPKDNIERAIKKAAGGEAETFETVRYEGYGAGGVHQARRQPRRDGCRLAHVFPRRRDQLSGRRRLGRRGAGGGHRRRRRRRAIGRQRASDHMRVRQPGLGGGGAGGQARRARVRESTVEADADDGG